MIVSIITIAGIGLAISLYAYTTETKVKQDPDYKPMCDISDKVSCTKPMIGPYGSLLGFSNAVAGIGFYLLIILLALLNLTTFIFLFSLASLFVSAFLAYILYTKIQTLCLICSSIYFINIALFIASLKYL